MLNKFWNGKISGIPGCIALISSRILTSISDKMTSALLKRNLAQTGKNVKILRGFYYRYPSSIFIFDNVCIGQGASFNSELPNRSVMRINNGVSIGNYCKIDFTGGVTILEDVHLAHHVEISTHDHGYNYRNQPVGKPLVICENVFIGSYVHILHNVNRIGSNAIIGTGAIVTKDVPDNTIVAGNPAKTIGSI